MVKVANMQHIFQCIKQDLYVLKMDNQPEVLNGIEEELEDWECEQQQKAIREVNQNYQKISNRNLINTNNETSKSS